MIDQARFNRQVCGCDLGANHLCDHHARMLHSAENAISAYRLNGGTWVRGDKITYEMIAALVDIVRAGYTRS